MRLDLGFGGRCFYVNNNKTNWVNSKTKAEISFLWENNGPKVLFIKLPQAFNGTIKTDGTVLHSAIVRHKTKTTSKSIQ
jgi:hypothetical protein